MKIKVIILLILASFLLFFAATAQTVVSLTNSANTIKITYSDGSWNVISKRGSKIINPVGGTVIYLIDLKKATYVIDWNNIISPIAVNKDALAVVIKNYLN